MVRARIGWFLSLVALMLFVQLASANQRTAYLLELQGAIGPAVADYIVRGIVTAEDAKASVIIIQMDTPGGLASSMHDIDKAILASTVPVVTYVSPSGARAASAGTYILYASNFAAMAPGTNLGAASPVSLGMTGTASKDDTMTHKATNDAMAYIRSLAQLRGRNVDWAEQAVTKAETLSAKEALDKNVINFMSQDLTGLLLALNGQQTQVQGKSFTVQTQDSVIKKIEPDWRSRFLAVITDPSVAYLLLLAGFYGLFLEFTTPGMILPGVLGTIALLTALYALQLLPVNYVGLSLIILGLGFIASEVFITSHGILAIGGVIAFVLGSVMLMDTDLVGFGIPLPLIFTVSAVTIIFVFLILRISLRSQHLPQVTGREEILASTGIVVAIHGKRYQVRIKGELWQAECDSSLRVGQRVSVRDMQGLILQVVPYQGE